MRLILLAPVASFALVACEAEKPVNTDPDTQTVVPTEDFPPIGIRRLIAEANRVSAAYGENIWTDWTSAPSGVVLVTDDREILFCHEGKAEGWTDLGQDPVTSCSMLARARVFPQALLATFPAVDGVATTVVGTPDATGKTPTAWTVTLLHERMHQYQDAWSGYYQGVAALNLAGDDDTGEWMLNYPFPYDKPETVEAFGELAIALRAAMNGIAETGFESKLQDYLAARKRLRATVSDAEWRYLEFQFWKEGVSRWFEYAISQEAGREEDRYKSHADEVLTAIGDELAEIHAEGLNEWKRVAFYAVGGGEAVLLDAAVPNWREQYFSAPFALGPYFEMLER